MDNFFFALDNFFFAWTIIFLCKKIIVQGKKNCPYKTTTKNKDFCPFDEGRKSQNK